MRMGSLDAVPASPLPASWYADWQNRRHVERFDHRARLTPRGLVRNFESFNDVRLLREGVAPGETLNLLEVGCATGEFYRYLQIRYRDLRYTGLDLSEVAIARARDKYRGGRFGVVKPQESLRDGLAALGWDRLYPVVYSKDVLHHQVDPWGFLRELLAAASDWVVLRTRTRDQGQSVLDPELSCQYHYSGWIPYLVFNLTELADRIRQQVPSASITAYRSHTILGGWKNRHLPKACYLPETGTAETALAVRIHGGAAGELLVKDLKDAQGSPSWVGRLWQTARGPWKKQC
ncbi:MAG: methyltransferase domain-containing protein [Candidatus Omnitrophica bacterium]|nr:methyltransferase domain-containing protein [Candidatus Omnitrophota bacterium]